jgi:A/G-specific adenine glycosylase
VVIPQFLAKAQSFEIVSPSVRKTAVTKNNPWRQPDSSKRLAILCQRLMRWFVSHARDMPWRRTRDPYAIWVSEIMLQQTQVKTVVAYYERWMRALPNLAALACASSEQLYKLWEGLGYYTRVRNMHRAAQVIMAEHDGVFPRRYEEILALPGIGRYTAGAICSIALGQPTAILDGNVIRVLSRVYGVEGDTAGKEVNARLWSLAQALVTAVDELSLEKPANGESGERREWFGNASPCSLLNQSLMELGALVCTPQNPGCGICPIKGYCTAFETGRVEQIPSPRKRPEVTTRRFLAFVLRDHDRYLVRRRPANVVNGNLWEFPNQEVKEEDTPVKAARVALGAAPGRITKVQTIRHSITRYRILLEVYRVQFKTRNGTRVAARDLKERWLNLQQLSELPFASAHRKILWRLTKDQSA